MEETKRPSCRSGKIKNGQGAAERGGTKRGGEEGPDMEEWEREQMGWIVRWERVERSRHGTLTLHASVITSGEEPTRLISPHPHPHPTPTFLTVAHAHAYSPNTHLTRSMFPSSTSRKAKRSKEATLFFLYVSLPPFQLSHAFS